MRIGTFIFVSDGRIVTEHDVFGNEKLSYLVNQYVDFMREMSDSEGNLGGWRRKNKRIVAKWYG